MNEKAFEIYNEVNSELKAPFWHCIEQQMGYMLSISVPFSMSTRMTNAMDSTISIEANIKLT